MLCGSLDQRGVWGRMDPCMYMTESLQRSPEAVTTLLIGYTPIQNKKLKDILLLRFYLYNSFQEYLLRDIPSLHMFEESEHL